METTTHDGRGRAPFDPHEDFVSLMYGWCNTFSHVSQCLAQHLNVSFPGFIIYILDQTVGEHRETSLYKMFSVSPTYS